MTFNIFNDNNHIVDVIHESTQYIVNQQVRSAIPFTWRAAKKMTQHSLWRSASGEA